MSMMSTHVGFFVVKYCASQRSAPFSFLGDFAISFVCGLNLQMLKFARFLMVRRPGDGADGGARASHRIWRRHFDSVTFHSREYSSP